MKHRNSTSTVCPCALLHARSYEEDVNGIVLRLTNGKTVRAKVLIGADGTPSSVRHQCRSDDDQLYQSVNAS
jgi:2-polyprenyl-6-methoxyphenol hydroxylase-like FAD-dependent oxidoreductase